MRNWLSHAVLGFVFGIITADYLPLQEIYPIHFFLLLVLFLISIFFCNRLISFSLSFLYVFLGWSFYNPLELPYPNLSHQLTNSSNDHSVYYIGKIVEHINESVKKDQIFVSNIEVCDLIFCKKVPDNLVIQSEAPLPVSNSWILFRADLKLAHSFNNPDVNDSTDFFRRVRATKKGWLNYNDYIIYYPYDSVKDGFLERSQIYYSLHSFRQKIKNKFIKIFEKHFSDEEVKGLIIGMVLGDRSFITDDMQQYFAYSGLSHTIAISGSHFALIAIMAGFLAKFISLFVYASTSSKFTKYLPMRRLFFIWIISVIWFYGYLVGLNPAIERAVFMITFALFAKYSKRKASAKSIISLASFVILIRDPTALWDIGCQLSFTSVIALVYLAPIVYQKIDALKNILSEKLFLKSQSRLSSDSQKNRILAYCLNYIYSFIVLSFSATFSATVLTMPLCLKYFNQISLVSIPSNIIAGPFLGVLALPLAIMGLLSVLLSEVFSWGILSTVIQISSNFIFYITYFISKIGIDIATFFGNTAIFPIFWGNISNYELLYFYCFIYLFFVLKSLNSKAWVLILFLVIFSSSYFDFIKFDLTKFAFAKGGFFNEPLWRITMLNVGQGDCIIFQTPNNYTVIIDGGGTSLKRGDKKQNTAKRFILPFLKARGIYKIDLMIMTHPHPDHVGGLIELSETITVGSLLINEAFNENSPLYSWKNYLLKKGVNILEADSIESKFFLDGISFEILHPFLQWRKDIKQSERNSNNASIVFKSCYKNICSLFTGDIEETVEKMLVDNKLISKVDILKVCHHGSKTSSSKEFIEKLNPRIALIGAGFDNRYMFPHWRVLMRLKDQNSTILSTSSVGGIELATNGVDIWKRLGGSVYWNK